MASKKVVRGNVSFMLSIAAILCFFSPAASALNLCENPDLWPDLSFVMILDMTESVDISCEIGPTIVSNSTVNLMPGAHIKDSGSGDGYIMIVENSTVNVYGGVIDTMLNIDKTATVIVYGSAFAIDGNALDSSVEEIVGPDTFVLTGLYQNETSFSLPVVLEEDARLSLGWPDVPPQTSPEIDVQPAQGFWDFGDVEVGQNTTYEVQIYNYGTAPLTVSSVTLTGDADFTIAGLAAPLVIEPSTSVGVDFVVTFTPTELGYKAASVIIESNDEDEGTVEVSLYGMGISAEVPPLVQIQNILAYFDASVADGTLLGYGPGNSPKNRLKALRNMIEAADDLILAEAYDLAIIQLEDIAKKTDGLAKPQDFVVGEAVPMLNAMINNLIADLAS